MIKMDKLMEVVDKLLFGVGLERGDYQELEKAILTEFNSSVDLEYQYRKISEEPEVRVRLVGGMLVSIDIHEDGEEYRLSFNKEQEQIYLSVQEEDLADTREGGLILERC